eukprot:scaffold135209_cov244-Phaeocystis_antarctica.AAC.1
MSWGAFGKFEHAETLRTLVTQYILLNRDALEESMGAYYTNERKEMARFAPVEKEMELVALAELLEVQVCVVQNLPCPSLAPSLARVGTQQGPRLLVGTPLNGEVEEGGRRQVVDFLRSGKSQFQCLEDNPATRGMAVYLVGKQTAADVFTQEQWCQK